MATRAQKRKPTRLDRKRFVIELEAMPSPIPVAARLKRLLKYALRCLDLKCTRIVPDDIEVTDGDYRAIKAAEAAGENDDTQGT